jgi:PAS domain S-box-containing protein
MERSALLPQEAAARGVIYDEEISRLKRRERSLTAIFSHLPVPLSLQGADGRFVLVNPAFCGLIGRKTDEIIGKTSWEMLSGKDAADMKKRFVQACQTGQSPAPRDDLSESMLGLEMTALKNSSGTVVAVISYSPPGSFTSTGSALVQVLQDITGMSVVPKALYDSSGMLIASHPDFWKYVTGKGFGTHLRTLPGSWMDALRSAGAMKKSQLFPQPSSGDEALDVPSIGTGKGRGISLVPVRPPGGDELLAIIAECPVEKLPGPMTIADMVLAPIDDTTGREQGPDLAEDDTSHDAFLYNAILETHPGIVLLLSLEGRITDYSGGVLTPVLLGREELKGTHVIDLIAPGSRGSFTDLLERVVRGSPREEGICTFGGPGEERVFRVVCTSAGGNTLVCTLSDLTHEREVESKAIRCHDLVSLDLSAWISEALRDTARAYPRIAPEMSGQFRQIIGHIRRCVDVTRAFSASEKIASRPSGFRSIPVDRIIRAEVANFPDLSIRYKESRAAVIADDSLSDVIWFILANAARYAGPSARIIIEVLETRNLVEIRVTDTGPGIPRELMEELLSPRSMSDVHGLLRGLPLSRALVERMGGMIRIRERVSGAGPRGTVISIFLKEGPSPVRSFPL